MDATSNKKKRFKAADLKDILGVVSAFTAMVYTYDSWWSLLFMASFFYILLSSAHED